jgi:anti-anti-sigma factor
MTSAFMTNAICEEMVPLTMIGFDAADVTEAVRGQIVSGQLVRGQDAVLLECLGPLVRKCNVALDLSNVERIDAAGITALLSLYQSARESGHRFSLTNVSARVAQILAVVGLDRHLVSHNAVQDLHRGSQSRRPAA